MAPVNLHSFAHFFILLLCCSIAVGAHGKENATRFPVVALVDTAAEVVETQEAGGTLDGDVELGAVDDASMLQWAIAHVDPLKMRQMATEARGWSREELEAKNAELQQLLETVRPPSDFQVMQELLDVASNGSEPSSRRAAALDALQEVVEAIDNARDLHKAGGIPTLVKLLADDDVNVRIGAAWVVGTAVQNNQEVQTQFLNTTCLPSLLAMVRSSDSNEAAKALYAVGALVRNLTKGFRDFCKNGGSALLGKIILDACADSRLQRKAVGLLGDLATFRDRDGWQLEGYGPLATLEVMRAMLGFMPAGDVDMREKVTRAVLALLNDNVQTIEFFYGNGEVVKVVQLEERLDTMIKGIDESSGRLGEEWQRHMREMVEVIEQIEDVIKIEAQLGPRKVDWTKDEL